MDDYISRESALKAIYTSTAPALEVKAIPAADVKPVVHGKWMKQPKDFDLCGVEYFACDKCGFECQLTYNFCPNCGCSMRDEE